MHESAVVTTVIAVIALLLIAAVSAIILKRLNLPFTVGLVIVGLALGAFAERFEGLEMLSAIELSPEIILFVFLPTLIFESAFNLNSRLLAQNLGPVLALAAPGLLLSTGIVGGLLMLLTDLTPGPALLFGALISATDPVAVVALFKEVGAPKRLAVLIEGESLFNDATAIVLFQIILVVIAAGSFTAGTLGSGVIAFVRVFAGGLIVGALIGYLMIRTIALADEEPLVQVALSTVVAYAAFILADHYLHVSGVMSSVGAGLVIGTMGSTRFDVHLREYLEQFWEYAAFVANSLIFLLVGMSLRLDVIGEHIVPILLAIAVATLARATAVFGLLPVVQRFGGETIDMRYRGVMFWGGLRGAVALALVLSLAPDFPFRELILAMALGVVLFTLLSGGLTMSWLIRKLGLNDPTLVERVALAEAKFASKREASRRISELATSGHFSSHMIRELQEQYQAEVLTAQQAMQVLQKLCNAQDMRDVLWSQALTVERTTYRELYEKGLITEPVLKELELAIDVTHDSIRQGKLDVEELKTTPIATPLEVRVANLWTSLIRLIAPASRYVQRRRISNLAAKYEHDSAVLQASQRVLHELDRLAELSNIEHAIVEEHREAWHAREQEAIARIDAVAEHFPEYVTAVQHQTASRIALDGEVDAVAELTAAGVIPDLVARESRHAVEKAQRRLARQPVEALEPEPSELLSKVPMFSQLAPEDHERLAAHVIPRTVLADEVIIKQGDRGDSLFLISRGVVAVLITRGTRGERRVNSLHAGDFFGEMALLTAERRTATVKAITDCQLYELSKKDVESLYPACPTLRPALEQALVERREAQERRESVLAMDAVGKTVSR
ncbi:MAG: cation:proton antiporter [Gemmatimonadales bacterium]